MQTTLIIGIILGLMNFPKLVAKDLATKYEVSVRTIYRYVDALSSCGFPISTSRGAKGGIYLINNIKFDQIAFSTKELNHLKEGIFLLDLPNAVKENLIMKLNLVQSKIV